MSAFSIDESLKINEVKLVVFQVENQQFALPLGNVVRAIHVVNMRELPNSPKYVSGLINFHGEIIAVINLRLLFSLPSKEMELNDQLLIVSTSDFKMALWIDSIQDLMEIDEEYIVRSENIRFGEKSVQGVIKLEDGMVLLNDVDRFLNPTELQELQAALLSVEAETSNAVQLNN